MRHLVLCVLLGFFLSIGGISYHKWQFWTILLTVALMCLNIRDES